jgi:hypothetical protein
VIVAIGYRREIAATARRVRAAHQAAGSPQLAALDQLWQRLEQDLAAPVAREDAAGVEAALKKYERQAVGAIRRAGTNG